MLEKLFETKTEQKTQAPTTITNNQLPKYTQTIKHQISITKTVLPFSVLQFMIPP